MPKLSAYELEREANIARNRAILDQLNLKQAVADLDIPKKEPSSSEFKGKVKPIQPAKKRKVAQVIEDAPRRQSSRLRKEVVDPNETPYQKRKREAEMEERRAREAEERLEAEEKARLAKRPRHNDLDLEILFGVDDEEAQAEVPSLRKSLQTVLEESRPKGIAEVDAYAWKEDKRHQKAVEELREKLGGLKVVSRAKVTQDRVYSAAYHPEPSKDLIFFGDKHGQLGIWDARAPADEVTDNDEEVSKDEKEGGKYWRLQMHWPATSISSISCIRFNPVDSHSVYTSSYDCTIRHLSFTSGISTEIYAATDRTLITSIDLVPDGHQMWMSDALGGLTHRDLRQDKSKARRYVMAPAKIGCVSVNPTNAHFLVTASNSRHLQIWDIRKLGSMNVDASSFPTPPSSPVRGGAVAQDDQETLEFDEEIIAKFLDSSKGKGILRGEWKHDKSVSSAYWDPSGTNIVSTSYDDRLRIWTYDGSVYKKPEAFRSSRPSSSISHDCQTGRWLTVLKAQWSTNPNAYPHFTVGNMKHSLDIFSCKGDLIARLADPSKITAVQAVTCSHPSVLERAASGNGSGRCVLWAPADSD